MNGVLLYHETLDNKSKTEILNLASNCYSHVIRGEKTFLEWSKAISENYDLKDRRNKIIHDLIKATEGTIANYPNVGKVKMRYRKFNH